MNLLDVARIPPVTATAEMSVYQAVELMAKNEVGAIVITDSNQRISGIFTERDNMLRVTLKSLDPKKTALRDVMSSPVQNASPEITPSEALERMLRSRYRHLPVADREGKILGMVSLRQLLMKRIDEQESSLETLSAYVESGGPG